MLGLTSRLVVEFRTGVFPAGLEAGVITSDNISSASYSNALNSTSSFQLNIPGEYFPGSMIDGGYFVAYESITDGTGEIKEVVIGEFAISSVEFLYGDSGEWMARVTGESAVTWEMSSAGIPYPNYGSGTLFQSLSFAQLACGKDRRTRVQIPVHVTQLLTRQALAMDGSSSAMEIVSRAAQQNALIWRPLDASLGDPRIQLFDVPPAAPPYVTGDGSATVAPANPSMPDLVVDELGSPTAIYPWSDCRAVFDMSRRYDEAYLEGGRWRETVNNFDNIIVPDAGSVVVPYVVNIDIFGRRYFKVARALSIIPPRRTTTIRFPSVRPPINPPSLADIDVAQQALIEAGYRALTAQLNISRVNYFLTVPGSMLYTTRAGSLVSGQLAAPHAQGVTEIPSQILRATSVNVAWSSDGKATTTLELASTLESFVDQRITDYGKDRYVFSDLQDPPIVANDTTQVTLAPTSTALQSYTFPVAYASPPLVTVWDAQDNYHPVIVSVSATGFTYYALGAVAGFSSFVTFNITFV